MISCTPMVQQYRKIKQECPDAILFFRLGDFYEMFYEDAHLASRELSITLTGRDAGSGQRAPMCGIPYHAADSYIEKLIERGYKVAICEQVEDPKTARGLVRREVVRVITPGTFVSNSDPQNNFIISLAKYSDAIGLAAGDLSTGELIATEFQGHEALRLALVESGKYSPRECILIPGLLENADIASHFNNMGITLTVYDRDFSHGDPGGILKEDLGVISLQGYDCEHKHAAVAAAAAIVSYLRDTQHSVLPHMNSLKVYSATDYVIIDSSCRKNLEIFERISDGSREGSLFDVLDRTCTAMGTRLMRSWLERPLRNPSKIEERLDAVQELVNNGLVRATLRDALKHISDLERLAYRIGSGTANARDLVSLKLSIEGINKVREVIQSPVSELLRLSMEEMSDLSEVHDLIDKSISEDPPVNLKEGKLIRACYNHDVDALRCLTHEGKGWIADFEASEKERTGIKSLKVGFNKVFGYYIEVTNANKDLVPEDYVRKQTLVNAERYITPMLKEKESQVLTAQERLASLEYELFVHIRNKVSEWIPSIQDSARAVALLDVVASLAEAAVENAYTRPAVDESEEIRIQQGRHPVVERILGSGAYVPNDTLLDTKDNRLIILTGPNMGGKSTYLRQVALITLMAQVGSYVPAASARIGVVDRIFTRVGAYDDLFRGQSTFMVEMLEVANILNNATRKSLIVLDEIGRGTGTYDGMSIAWAVAEYIHDKKRVGARTLMATHYRELLELEKHLQGAKNYSVAVKEKGKQIVFMRQVVRGGASSSYGVAVARLAGLPEEVVQRAGSILAVLSAKETRSGRVQSAATVQLPLFEHVPDPIVQELLSIDTMRITPLDALNLLNDLQNRARGTHEKDAV